MADFLVAVVMTHDLPNSLEEEILELIHELYRFGGNQMEEISTLEDWRIASCPLQSRPTACDRLS